MTASSNGARNGSDGASADAAHWGLPDEAVLQELANELYREAPSLASLVEFATSPEYVREAAAFATDLHQSLEALARPAAAPALADATAPGGVWLAPAAEIPGPGNADLVSPYSTPGFPGGFSGLAASAVPDFGFLQEARPLFDADPGAAIEAASRAISFAEARLPEIGAGHIVQPAAPAIPGAPVPNEGYKDRAALKSFEDVRSIRPVLMADSHSFDLARQPIQRSVAAPFDLNAVRRDFPILQEQVNGRSLVWLDNAATTQKPQAVIDRLSYFYAHENSNIHRAAHTLAARATDAYELSREKVKRFLNAASPDEIIFVRGTTEAINLVSQSWGRRHIGKDDEIVLTHLEHHANIVPWQMLAAEKGARIRVVPVDDSGQVILDEYQKLLGPRTRLVALAHVSNALGTITPVREMVELAHRYGATALVDGAQAVSHMPVDVQALGADFYVFSGHKIFGPTGIGVVYGRADVLEQTPPWQGGGNMIADVTFERTVYQRPPTRFEAGTGNIADAVGLGAALDYVERLGMTSIERYEHDLLQYALDALRRIPGLRLIGTAREKASVLSFVLAGHDPVGIGAALSREGIAVRAGHHCAQPILRRFGVEATVRPSLAFYNTCDEIDALVAAIRNLIDGRNRGLV